MQKKFVSSNLSDPIFLTVIALILQQSLFNIFVCSKKFLIFIQIFSSHFVNFFTTSFAFLLRKIYRGTGRPSTFKKIPPDATRA
jgi:hypothetical protein